MPQAQPVQSDSALVAGLKAGDDSAFEEVLRRYETKVYSLVRSLTRNDSDAQDALQDAFLSVFRKIRTFREASSLSTWIYRIAVNAALMKLRGRKRDRNSVSIDEFLPQFDASGHRLLPETSAPARADDLLERKELAEFLREAIRSLPPDHRTVFVLRDQEGLSTEEVAGVLGLSVPAVKSRLHRARLYLRERVRRQGYGAARKQR
jgi:RNA polymerase sigma-70 factor (ECF subfamily)